MSSGWHNEAESNKAQSMHTQSLHLFCSLHWSHCIQIQWLPMPDTGTLIKVSEGLQPDADLQAA